MPSTCRSCGTAIIWAITAKGKRMPLDERLVEGGRWIVNAHGHLIARPPGIKLGHESHFYTCPDADRHRRSR